MSSASSTASWQAKLRAEQDNGIQSRPLSEYRSSSTLERQQSSGSLILRSIGLEFMEQCQELWESFNRSPSSKSQDQQNQYSIDLGQMQAAHSENFQQPMYVNTVKTHTSSAKAETAVDLPPFGGSSHSQGNIITTGFGDSSPAVDTPLQQNKQPSGLRILQSTRSEPVIGTPTKGRATLEARTSGMKPEVSLAARAGSMGATSMQSSHKNIGIKKALSDTPRSSESDEVDAKSGPEAEQAVRKGPGRKKRTTPILVETEEGETKYVTPTEYRKLRRRITNRLSARRMRKKHAEERAMIHDNTNVLQAERDALHDELTETRRQLEQLDLHCRQLIEENRALKRIQTWRPTQVGIGQFSDTSQAPAQSALQGFRLDNMQPSAPMDMQPYLPPISVTPGTGLTAPYLGSFSFSDIQVDDEMPHPGHQNMQPLEHYSSVSGPQLEMPQIPLSNASLPMSHQAYASSSQQYVAPQDRHPASRVYSGRPMQQ